MELVLGVSMAPTSIRMVLVEGESADGVTVEEDNVTVAAASDAPTISAADQVIDAIVGTRQGATQAGSQLMSTGVAWTDKAAAAALRDALAARKVENVMLVSAFLAAAALAHTVGSAIGYQHTAMLFVEPDTATLAVVDSADGSITDVYRRVLPGGFGADTVTQLIGMIVGVHALPSRPGGVFVVGSGVDIAPIKPRLEAATSLTVSAPEEPETAMARGAALASANAPLFASSTAALAYAQDPGTGAIDRYALAPEYAVVDDPAQNRGFGGDELLAYSAVPDEDASAETVVLDRADDWDSTFEHADAPRRRPMLLTGSALAATVVTAAALALVITLAINIRTTVALRPAPGQALIVPAAQPPAPALAEPQALPAATLHLPATPPVPARVATAPQLNLPAPAAPPLPAAPIPAAPPVIVAPVPIAPVPIPAHLPAPAPPIRMPAPQLPLRLPGPQLPIQMQAPQPAQLPNSPQQGPFSSPQQELFPKAQQGPFPRPQQGLFPRPQQGQLPQHLPGGQPPSDQVPELPRQLPAQPPRELPEPQAPRYPTMPEPQAPRMPTMPEPQAPRIPDHARTASAADAGHARTASAADAGSYDAAYAVGAGARGAGDAASEHSAFPVVTAASNGFAVCPDTDRRDCVGRHLDERAGAGRPITHPGDHGSGSRACRPTDQRLPGDSSRRQRGGGQRLHDAVTVSGGKRRLLLLAHRGRRRHLLALDIRNPSLR